MTAKTTMDELYSFLNECRLTYDMRNAPHTHTTRTNSSFPKGKYYIPPEYIDDFFAIYSNVISKERGIPSITEKPEAYGPLRVDFDFKASLDVGLKRQYSEKTLKAIVGIYQEELKAAIEPDDFRDEMLWCIVLEKEAPRSEEGKVVDGFHLHFPHFICEGKMQDKFLRDRVISKMLEQKIWDHAKFTSKIADIIDQGMATKQWMMYGSANCKTKTTTAYMYNRRQKPLIHRSLHKNYKDPWEKTPLDKQWGHVYDHNLKEIPMADVFADELAGRKNSVKYYLPRFLSIRGYDEATPLCQAVRQKLTIFNYNNGKRRKKAIHKKRNMEDVLKDIKIIKDGRIMEMLSDERADDRDMWMDVGWTLFNIGQGHDEALDMWIEFSQRSSRFKHGECEELWDSMEVRDKTIGSLLRMAQNDSPDYYKEWKNMNTRGFMYKSVCEVKPTEYDVAMVVVSMYKDRFCCADAKKDIWYDFHDHRWHLMDDSIDMKVLLVDEVIEAYYEFKSDLSKQECSEPTMRDKLAEQSKRVVAIISKLKTVKFHKQVIEMCKLKMKDSSFLKKMNENKMLFCCENGVLDLEMGIFRDGRPDDYCTFSSGIEYTNYNDDDDEMMELDETLLKVFPNDNRRKYFIDMLSSCLRGGNIHKRFMICTGPSDGGKSMLFKLIGMVFGEYMGKFPRELLMTGRGNSSGSARPELTMVRGKRIMSTQELTHKDNIDIGVVKELTGNDSFYARNLFEKGTDINPQFTLWIQVNDPPKIPGHDEATWSRTRLVDCESKFVKPQDRQKWPVAETFEKQLEQKRFAADPEFADKLPEMAPVLLCKLFKNLSKIKSSEMVEPEEVMMSTKNFKDDNDVYANFIRDKIHKETDKEEVKSAFIRLAEIYSIFKEWYRENYPSYNKELIGKNTMKDELCKRLGVIKDEDKDIYGFGKLSRFYGYNLVQDADSIPVKDEEPSVKPNLQKMLKK